MTKKAWQVQDNSVSSREGPTQFAGNTYKQQSWRFVNLVLFIMVCLVNSLPTHTFTPINSVVQSLFGYKKVAIAVNTLLFPISHPVLAFPVNWILDRFGLRIGCTIGVVFLTVGVWMRVLISSSLIPVIAGSFCAAVGNIFIINSPAKFATTWFRQDVVARVTTIGVMCNMASIALGVVLPSLFVNQTSSKSDVQRMLIYEAIIVSVPCILIALLFRGKPKNPPSHAAGLQHGKEYSKDLKTLFRNRNYLFLLLAVSMSYGALTCFTTVIEYIILPFKYSKPQQLASTILLIAIGVGVFSSVVFVLVLKKSQEYRKILIFAMIGAMVEMLCFMFALGSHRVWLLLLTIGLTGYFFIPQIALFLELGCEVAFPIGEASSSGFLLAGGQLTGFLTGLAAISFLNGSSQGDVYIVVSILSGMILVGVVSMCFVKEDLRRTRFQKDQSQIPKMVQ